MPNRSGLLLRGWAGLVTARLLRAAGPLPGRGCGSPPARRDDRRRPRRPGRQSTRLEVQGLEARLVLAPVAPGMVLGTGVADGATQAEATQASGIVTVSGEKNATVYVSFVGTTNGGGDAGKVVTKVVTGQGPNVPIPVTLNTADVAKITNGQAYAVAFQTIAGGQSPNTVLPFIIDTVKPPGPGVVPGKGVADGATPAEATQAAGIVTVSGEKNATVYVSFVGTTNGGGDANKVVTKAFVGQGPSVPLSVTLAGADLVKITAGPVYVVSCQVDAAGNQGDNTVIPFTLGAADGSPSGPGYPLRAGGPDDDVASSITRLADGSVILTGSFRGTATFGDKVLASLGERDIFVARFDPLGSCTSAMRVGGEGDDFGTGIATLGDGKSVVVTGLFSKTVTFGGTTLSAFHADGKSVFVARMDANGAFVWAVRSQGTGSHGNPRIAALADDSVVVAGDFRNGTIWFAGSPGLPTTSQDIDMYVAKLDAGGKGAWTRVIGGQGEESFGGVAACPDGSVVLTGAFERTIVMDGKALKAEGGLLVKDILVAKLTPGGKIAWARRVGSYGDDFGRAVAVLADGTIMVTGTYRYWVYFGNDELDTIKSNRGMFIARMTADGGFIWAKKYGDDSHLPDAVTVRASGSSIALSGTFVKNAADPDDRNLFLVLMGSDGANVREYASAGSGGIGGFPFRGGPRVAALADGSIVVAGTYEWGAVSFGSTSLPSPGGTDVFLAKLKDGSFNLPPAAPTGVVVTPRGGAVEVFWTAPAPSGGPAVNDYIVQYRPAGQRVVSWTTMPAIFKSTATSAKVTGLVYGSPYVFRVAAVSSAGVGPYSGVSAAVTPRTVPGIPKGLSAVAGGGQATLSWSPPASDGGSPLTSYRIMYAKQVGAVWNAWVTVNQAAASPTTLVIGGLAKGSTYVFKIAAVNALGVGPETTPGVTVAIGK